MSFLILVLEKKRNLFVKTNMKKSVLVKRNS